MKWTGAVKKGKDITKTLASLANRAINNFKPGRFVIQSPPNATPLRIYTHLQIIKQTNNVLQLTGILVDGKAAIVKGATKLPSNDMALYTKKQAKVHILYKNKHLWTSLVDKALPTLPNRYPVLIDGLLVDFRPEYTEELCALAHENNIGIETFASVRWLEDQQKGSVVLCVLDKVLADKLKCGGVFCKGSFFMGQYYEKPSPQCFQCWHVGHMAKWCKYTPFCSSYCGGHYTFGCMEIKPKNNLKMLFVYQIMERQKSWQTHGHELQIDHQPQSGDFPVRKGWADARFKRK
ncbi:hypothetical protein CROQUDRAFT_44869 [Cronartium quercuum f. sp. fusiforme G11]|uniref:Uncharacterized protein n=1 Tax=Cronartium quercuum f. sp. fusiforme G11 TaxID=708437 RepID=A0A9P6TBE3_9BASI|nr:hypothetical protein CROQUDRAFT_44869 [Cronartium quercuum f. sp. fusiforme G11]